MYWEIRKTEFGRKTLEWFRMTWFGWLDFKKRRHATDTDIGILTKRRHATDTDNGIFKICRHGTDTDNGIFKKRRHATDTDNPNS